MVLIMRSFGRGLPHTLGLPGARPRWNRTGFCSLGAAWPRLRGWLCRQRPGGTPPPHYLTAPLAPSAPAGPGALVGPKPALQGRRSRRAVLETKARAPCSPFVFMEGEPPRPVPLAGRFTLAVACAAPKPYAASRSSASSVRPPFPRSCHGGCGAPAAPAPPDELRAFLVRLRAGNRHARKPVMPVARRSARRLEDLRSSLLLKPGRRRGLQKQSFAGSGAIHWKRSGQDRAGRAIARRCVS